MTEIESLFIDRMYSLLSKYTPNDTTLNNFSSFLYREFLSLFKDVGVENIVSEIEVAGRNEILDLESFNKALKDISFFTSENYIESVLKVVTYTLKNQIPMMERKVEKVFVDSVSVGKGTVQSRTKDTTHDNYEFDKNVGSFDIDLSSIPRVEELRVNSNSKKEKKESVIAENISRITEVDRNVFSGVDLSGEESRIHKFVNKGLDSRNVSKESADEEDLTMDASYLTSGGYKSIPKVSIDLDY